jgi:Gluconate 2-dehydrogenase subunit 3
LTVGEAPLSSAQLDTLEAALERLIPTDELGPGARDAGVCEYVQRALAGPASAWVEEYSVGLEALDEVALARYGGRFATLTGPEQDATLRTIERGLNTAGFFELLRRQALEGMFGDPVWGGNRERAGWNLLSYPGPRAEWSAAEQALDAPPTPDGGPR